VLQQHHQSGRKRYVGTLPGDTELITYTQKFSVLQVFSSFTGTEKHRKEAGLNRERQISTRKKKEILGSAR